MHTPATAGSSRQVSIRPLAENDLEHARRTFRLAFGTFVGLPDPLAFMGDADLIGPRWRTDRASVFGAWVDAGFAGSNAATNWGSVGFFGPLTVRPDLWDSGIGKQLMDPVLERFNAWGTRHAGLFTFPHSQKHLGLYQRFGFRPRFLTAVMVKPVAPATPESPPDGRCSWLSTLAPEEQGDVLGQCRDLTDAVHEGLDVTSDIRAIVDQRLGDTVLLWRDGELVAFAACHSGPGTEAGSGACFVKFGAVRPGWQAPVDFDDLLSACELRAAQFGASQLVAGTNTAREEAYQRMLARGFRIDLLGVAMQRPNEPGYNRPGVYVIDDWR